MQLKSSNDIPKCASMANHVVSIQKLEEGAGASTGRDQAYTECAVGHWAVYGGYRSEVCISMFLQAHRKGSLD
jgi:hypothetical protein